MGMDGYKVVLFERERIVEMLLHDLFCSHGAEVEKVKSVDELYRRMKEFCSEEMPCIAVVGEPSPLSGARTRLLAFPRTFPGQRFILLKSGLGEEEACYGDFAAVVSKPFRFETVWEEMLRLGAGLSNQ